MSGFFEKLKTLQQKAYAPYSNYRVAAILVMENGATFDGVNVENASYGGTICAERSAFVSAISQLGHVDAQYQAIHLLAGKSDSFAMPCGFCRQVMSEFTADDFRVHVYNTQGESKSYTMAELLPYGFSKDELK